MGWMTVNQTLKTTKEKKDYLDRNVFKWCDQNTKTLKSAMVGSTYYAAVESIKEDGTREVWALICLTNSNARNGEFSYKDMSESAGPYECSCPAGILNLLTETNSEFANRWRSDCRAKLAEKTNPDLTFKVSDIIELKEPYIQKGEARITRKVKNSYVICMIDDDGVFKVSSKSLKEGVKDGSIVLVSKSS